MPSQRMSTSAAHTPRPDDLRVARALPTDADLTADQRAFFLGDTEGDGEAADEALGRLHLSRPAETPTSALLTPIMERVVTRRRPRPRPLNVPCTGFPRAEARAVGASRFARERTAERAVENGAPNDGNDARIAGMSKEEVEEALTDLRARFKPADLAFLAERGARRGAADKRMNDSVVSATAEASGGDGMREGKVPFAADVTGLRAVRDGEHGSDSFPWEESEETVDSATRAFPLAEVPGDRGAERPPAFSDQKQLSRRVRNMLQIRPDDESSEDDDDESNTSSNEGQQGQTSAQTVARLGEEELKKAWMSGARAAMQDQEDIDRVLEDSIKSLGVLGTRRYDLEGNCLSAEQIESLPTHLGLHHHGSSPASAGYTLTDVLLLTRSTVVTQRLIALRVLTAIVHAHGEAVVGPLAESGAFTLAFAPFPSSHAAAEHAPAIHQVYLGAVEALIGSRKLLETTESELDLYFASCFYSASTGQVTDPVLRAIGQANCVPTLVQISVAQQASERYDLAVRALVAVQTIVHYARNACEIVAGSAPTVVALKALARDLRSVEAGTALLACDVLVAVALEVGWRGPSYAAILRKDVLDEAFLRRISEHLGWLVEGGSELPQSYITAALGAVRLLRVAVTFDCGLYVFTSMLSGVYRLSNLRCKLAVSARQDMDEGSAAADAYLALEAYAHALYSAITQKADTPGTDPEQGDAVAATDIEIVAFAKDQLSGLIPVALEVATAFASDPSAVSSRRCAAAGHFVGTVLALCPVLLDKAVVARILDVCSAAVGAIDEGARSHGLSTSPSRLGTWAHLQVAASTAHAAARILTRAALDTAYVRNVVDCILRGAVVEGKRAARASPIARAIWRPVTNAAAEWLGVLTRHECSVDVAEKAVALLPYIADPQVIVDLLSRCILRPSMLMTLQANITQEVAENCAADLVPATHYRLMTAASELAVKTAETEADVLRTGNSEALVTIITLFELWIGTAGILDSAVLVMSALQHARIVSAKELYQTLLRRAPLNAFEESKSVIAAVLRAGRAASGEGGKLLPPGPETAISDVSTRPNSSLTAALLGLAERLVGRGPASGDTEGDALSSIVFTAMYRREADVSLRAALWKQTVEECGGGALFANAELFGELQGEDVESDEESEMLSCYGVALAHGFLLDERCPNVLRRMVWPRVQASLLSHSAWSVLAPLRAVQHEKASTSHRAGVETISRWMTLDGSTEEDIGAFLKLITKKDL